MPLKTKELKARTTLVEVNSKCLPTSYQSKRLTNCCVFHVIQVPPIKKKLNNLLTGGPVRTLGAAHPETETHDFLMASTCLTF